MKRKHRRTSWIELHIVAEDNKYETRVKSSRRIRYADLSALIYELERVRQQLILNDLAQDEGINISRKRGDAERMFG